MYEHCIIINYGVVINHESKNIDNDNELVYFYLLEAEMNRKM